MSIRVKICGITTHEAAEAATALGVDAVGFVFAESPRCVDIDRALELAAALAPVVTRVAVFRYPTVDWVREVIGAFRPHVVQVEPTPELLASMAGEVDLLPVLHDRDDLHRQLATATGDPARAGTVLLEAAGRGGRGVPPDWQRAAALARQIRLMLAGGLHAGNVRQALDAVRPFGVDVSSGVESGPGVKSPALMVEFVAAVRAAELELAERAEEATPS